MTIRIPSELEQLRWLVGFEAPRADEDALWRCSRAWRAAAAELRRLPGDAAITGERITTGLGGTSGSLGPAFLDAWQPLVGPAGMLDRLADACEQLGLACDRAAVEVEYAKLAFIAALVVLAATLAALGVALVAGGVSALGVPAAIAAAQFTIRLVLTRLAVAVMLGAAVNVALDGLVQSIQLIEGHRDGWNVDHTIRAAEDGAIYGAATGGVFLGAARFAPGATQHWSGIAGVLGLSGLIGGVAAPLLHGESPSATDLATALVSGAIGGFGPDLVRSGPHATVDGRHPVDLDLPPAALELGPASESSLLSFYGSDGPVSPEPGYPSLDGGPTSVHFGQGSAMPHGDPLPAADGPAPVLPAQAPPAHPPPAHAPLPATLPATLPGSSPTGDPPPGSTPAAGAPGSPLPGPPLPGALSPGAPGQRSHGAEPDAPAPIGPASGPPPGSAGPAAPGMATPGPTAPGSSAPGSSAPGSSAPGTATPGTAAPGMAAPGTASPGTAPPGTAPPGTAGPGTAGGAPLSAPPDQAGASQTPDPGSPAVTVLTPLSTVDQAGVVVAPDAPVVIPLGGALPVTDAEAVGLARQHVFATEAGFGFYARTDDNRMFAHAVLPSDGLVTLDLHGTPRGFRIEDGLLTPAQFADALRELARTGQISLPPGAAIRLVSCDTAQGGADSPAAALARALGVEVLAPDQPVWTTLDGVEVVSSPTLIDGNLFPKLPPDGAWHRFGPTGDELT